MSVNSLKFQTLFSRVRKAFPLPIFHYCMGSLVTHSFPNTVAVARLVLTILGQGRERFIVVLIVFVVAGVEAGPLLGLK